MKAKKALCLFISVLLILTAFAGCNVSDETYVDPEETTSVSFDVDLGFTSLKFPSRWKDSIRISQDFDGTIGTVEFYGSTGNHGEQLLFTLCFNQDGEIPIGTLLSDGQNIIICADMNELEFDESWTQDETDALCAMQEDINYIVEGLEQNPAFTSD